MNIIEQLGGYAKLKPHFITTDAALGYTHVYLHGNSHYCFLDDSVDYIIPERAIPIKDVINALLEYRREHSIFEEGDPVVMRGTSHYDICEFVEASTVLPMYMLKDENGCKFGINKKCVDHATPEEIAAGHRL